MRVVRQLCATLNKVHYIVVSFLKSGSLHALLSLPTSNLFSGFNIIASAIILHVVEDPNTLQQVMELEPDDLLSSKIQSLCPTITGNACCNAAQFETLREQIQQTWSLYLIILRENIGQKVDFDVIPELDIYKCDPWDLPACCQIPTRDDQWHFFTCRDRNPNGTHSNRATEHDTGSPPTRTETSDFTTGL